MTGLTGATLKVIREQRFHLTVDQFAHLLRVAPGTVLHWEQFDAPLWAQIEIARMERWSAPELSLKLEEAMRRIPNQCCYGFLTKKRCPRVGRWSTPADKRLGWMFCQWHRRRGDTDVSEKRRPK